MEITNERKDCMNCQGHRGRVCRYCLGTGIVPNIQDVVDKRVRSLEKMISSNKGGITESFITKLQNELNRLKTKTPSKVTCTLTEGFVIHFD